MDERSSSPIIVLIYHDFRGMAQTIRYILLYLNVPYQEVLLKQGQNILSLNIIKQRKITEEVDLPCLIDGKLLIQDAFSIIRYICNKFFRNDLLGQSLEQRTTIRQIYYNFLLKKKKELCLLFRFAQQAAQHPLKVQQIRKIFMQQSHEMSESLIPTIKLKFQNQNQKYIFGHITILDFLFYEECFYHVNLFGNLQQDNCAILTTINSIFNTNLYKYNDKYSFHLKIMKQFKNSFEKEHFYLQNKDKLNSYGIFSPIMKEKMKDSFRKVWLGPQDLLK